MISADVQCVTITDSDYDVPLMSAEEGDPGISAGRPTGTVHVCV